MKRRFGLILLLALIFLCASAAAESAPEIVMTASDNEGVPYDVRAVVSGSEITLYLPVRAARDSVTLEINGSEKLTLDCTETCEIEIGKAAYNLTAYQSNLPSLFLQMDDTDGALATMLTSEKHKDYVYGDMCLQVSDADSELYGWDASVESKENDEEQFGTCSLRGRGNSTWNPVLTVKNSFALKLEKKADLLGMGKAKSWVLLRNTYFMSAYMDKIAFDLAAAAGIEYTPESYFVDVFLNNQYYGLYLLTEKVQVNSSRVDITDMDEYIEENGVTDELDRTGGYLVELDNFMDRLQFQITGNLVTIHSPELLDTKVDENSEYAYLIERMSDLFDAIYGDGYMADGSHFMEHIDVDQFVRFYWVEELILNQDIGTGSTFMYKDIDSVDPLFHLGPLWDSNRAFPESKAKEWLVCLTDGFFGEKTIFGALMSHRAFAEKVVERYEDPEFRAVLESSVARTEEIFENIADSFAMDELRWPGEYPHTTVKYFTNILTRRLNWLDESYKQLLDMGVK